MPKNSDGLENYKKKFKLLLYIPPKNHRDTKTTSFPVALQILPNFVDSVPNPKQELLGVTRGNDCIPDEFSHEDNGKYCLHKRATLYHTYFSLCFVYELEFLYTDICTSYSVPASRMVSQNCMAPPQNGTVQITRQGTNVDQVIGDQLQRAVK